MWGCLCFCSCDGNGTFVVHCILLRGEFVSLLQGYGIAMTMVWFYKKKKNDGPGCVRVSVYSCQYYKKNPFELIPIAF